MKKIPLLIAMSLLMGTSTFANEKEAPEQSSEELHYFYQSKFYINLAIIPSYGSSSSEIGLGFGLAPGYHFNEFLSAGLFYSINLAIALGDSTSLLPAISGIQKYGIDFDTYFLMSKNSRFQLGLNFGFLNSTSVSLFTILPVGTGRYVAPFLGLKFGLRDDHSDGYTFGLELSPQWVFPTTITSTTIGSGTSTIQADGHFRVDFSIIFSLRP